MAVVQVQGWEERREEGRDEEKDAPHLQFSTYFPGFVPAGIRSISTISRFGSSHAYTFGLPEHLQTPGGGCQVTGFAGGVHQVTSAASTQLAALRTAHDWSAQASQALPLAALPHTLARVVAQLALGLVALVLLCGVTVRVQRCADRRASIPELVIKPTKQIYPY